jgi:hypothetical protein
LILLARYNAPNSPQAGAVIVNIAGQPVWEQPLANLVTTDFRVQTLHGKPVLTWWQGVIRYGHGVGSYVIADTSYAPIARVNAGNRHMGDLHELLLTSRGTALLTSYTITSADLRPVRGSRNGSIQNATLQELDLATGRVLLEWQSLDHVRRDDRTRHRGAAEAAGSRSTSAGIAARAWRMPTCRVFSAAADPGFAALRLVEDPPP